MRTFICGLLIIILLAPYNVYGADSVENLVDKKIEQAPVMVVAPIGSKIFFKVVYKFFKESMKSLSKGTDELIIKTMSFGINENIKNVDNLLKNSDAEAYVSGFIRLKINHYTGLISESVLDEWLTEALGYAFYKEMSDMGKKVKDFNAIEWGIRIRTILEKTQQDSFEKADDISFITNTRKYNIAIEILEKNPTIKLEKLASQVRAKIVAKSNKKINLGFAKKYKLGAPNAMSTEQIQIKLNRWQTSLDAFIPISPRDENLNYWKKAMLKNNSTKEQKTHFTSILEQQEELLKKIGDQKLKPEPITLYNKKGNEIIQKIDKDTRNVLEQEYNDQGQLVKEILYTENTQFVKTYNEKGQLVTSKLFDDNGKEINFKVLIKEWQTIVSDKKVIESSDPYFYQWAVNPPENMTDIQKTLLKDISERNKKNVNVDINMHSASNPLTKDILDEQTEKLVERQEYDINGNLIQVKYFNDNGIKIEEIIFNKNGDMVIKTLKPERTNPVSAVKYNADGKLIEESAYSPFYRSFEWEKVTSKYDPETGRLTEINLRGSYGGIKERTLFNEDGSKISIKYEYRDTKKEEIHYNKNDVVTKHLLWDYPYAPIEELPLENFPQGYLVEIEKRIMRYGTLRDTKIFVLVKDKKVLSEIIKKQKNATLKKIIDIENNKTIEDYWEISKFIFDRP